MRSGLVVAALFSMIGVARAEGDPLEVAAVAQAKGQAPDAVQVGPFYRGAGEKTDFQILLDGNKCYWFSGASMDLKKLYMYLWTPGAGAFTPRVADLRSPGQGTMAYCTQQSGMFKFQVKTEGKGHFVVGLFAKDAPKQVAVAPTPVNEKPAPDLGPLCDKTAKSAAPGAKLVGDYFAGKGNSIGRDDRSDYTIMMEGGKCYWVIGCGEPGEIKALSLYLWGPDNKRITEAKSDNPNPMIGHCAQATGMFKMQAKVSGGGGHYKVGIYSK